MFTNSFSNILKETTAMKIVVVGAGKYGRELAGALIDNGRDVKCFFDNKKDMQGLVIYGIPVVKPANLEEKDVKYVVSVNDSLVRYQLKEQMMRLGIRKDDTLCYFPHKCIDYHAELHSEQYKMAIENMFVEEFGRPLDWKNPQTYNEKINWEKINLHDDRRTLLADKNLVRAWVAEKIGEEHLTKHYGVWEHPEEIDFNRLPDKFVLKANNGSGRNILVTEKENIDRAKTIIELKYWMDSNYMFEAFEMHYGDIKPCIIAEEYLDGMAETLYDYNIFCFHGEPKYVWCIKGSHRPECTATFYDTDWNMQPFSYGYPLDVYPAPKPEKLEEMLKLTRVLCKDFKHVRVDWYMMPDGRLLFGEMTFQTWGGLRRFIPEKYDKILGDLI